MGMFDSMIEAGRQEKIREMKRIKMDIATSLNNLDIAPSDTMKCHEIVAYGFNLLEETGEEWGEPEGWQTYQDSQKEMLNGGKSNV